MSSSFYSQNELARLGFKRIGSRVLISRKASFYTPNTIVIGSNVRIDDFCLLSGEITLGNNIHIAAYTTLYAGNHGIEIKDFSVLSSRCAVYAVSDDYSGNALISPMVPEEFTNVIGGKVVLEKHVVIGTGSTIMPSVVLQEGVAVGSMSLVKSSLDAWGIYAGIPCRKIKARSKKVLELEDKLLRSNTFM